MDKTDNNKSKLTLPAVSLGAEYLVMGYLMRRNILTYKAPPNNAGYDLICIHPNPEKQTKVLRVQVKSRYQIDCDRGFPVKEKTFGSFDYLIIVFENIGYYYNKNKWSNNSVETIQPIEFYTLPASLIQSNHSKSESGWEKVMTKKLDLVSYKNELGFEQIAMDLAIEYPNK
jgi:hypothetical protein